MGLDNCEFRPVACYLIMPDTNSRCAANRGRSRYDKAGDKVVWNLDEGNPAFGEKGPPNDGALALLGCIGR